MRFEVPNFEHIFSKEEMKRALEVLKNHPHVKSAGVIGGFEATAQTLRFVVEVDDDDLFVKFSDCSDKEAGDQDVAVENRIAAVSYTLGDDLLAHVDECFGQSHNAGNFIDIVIVPPNWRERIDFVQSRLSFDDISAIDIMDAHEMNE